MEGICIAGTLEEAELVCQVRTRTRILHTQTHRSTAAIHMYVVHTQRALHGVQRFRRSRRRWYAVRFEEGEEHAAEEKEESTTSEQAHSRHPQHAAEMRRDRRTSDKKYAAAELKDAVAAARRHGRPHGQGRTADAQKFHRSATPRSAVYPTRNRNRGYAVCAARVFSRQSVVRSAVLI